MTKSETTILAHIKKQNGLTRPNIACSVTKYKLSTCVRVFKKLINNGIVTVEKAGDNSNLYYA